VGKTADRVTRIFESVRQTPGTSYERERLLAYLTEPPAATGPRVRDTFGGRRRFVRFMEDLQLEFGVCFTNEEWERGLGLAELTGLIEAKRGNVRAQARLASKRVQQARLALVDEPIKFGLLAAAVLAVVAAVMGSMLAYALLGSIWLCVVGGVAVLNARGYDYAKRLVGRIGSAVEQGVEADEAR
jgi:hypothetical protein